MLFLNFNGRQLVPISQVQSEQRAGRAGRTRGGICFRLYSQETHKNFTAVTVAEIKRVNLTGVVLELLCLGISNVLTFDFLEPPPAGAIVSSLKRLWLLAAIDNEGHPTPSGEAMARFPLEPGYSKCLLSAPARGVRREVVAIVACLSTTGAVWSTPAKTKEAERKEAQEQRKKWNDPTGDHLTLLNLFEAWENVPYHQRNSWCLREHVSIRVMREASEIYKQLMSHLDQQPKVDLTGDKRHQRDNKDDRKTSQKRNREEDSWRSAVLKCICDGLFFNAACRLPSADGWICIDADSRVLARPEVGSALDSNWEGSTAPEWLLFSELSGAHENQQMGLLRNVSIAPGEYLKSLLDRFNHLDVPALVKHCSGATATKKAAAKEATPKYENAAGRDVAGRKKIVLPAGNELDQKAADARERYLARAKTKQRSK
eukprot:GHVN01051658.1.p1 GENE.GHVN01051658.1~~GHVN01051658.1.p1  ORF type:complete len:430 (-),score=47.22 GHVN01051658.1:870-2159(-)